MVVSGLDFLKDEVKALGSSVRDKLEDLLNEMTVASASAVDTLTDVLDYELIDAGKHSERASEYHCPALPLYLSHSLCEPRHAEAGPELVALGPILRGQVQVGGNRRQHQASHARH